MSGDAETEQEPAEPSKSTSAGRDPYRSVLVLLLLLTVVGALGALCAAFAASFALDAAIALGLAAGALFGALMARSIRAETAAASPPAADGSGEPPPPPPPPAAHAAPEADAAQPGAAEPGATGAAEPDQGEADETAPAEPAADGTPGRRAGPLLKPWGEGKSGQAPKPPEAALDTLRAWLAGLVLLAISLVLMWGLDPTRRPTAVAAALVAAACLVAAGIAAASARYLGGVDPARLPEAPTLCRGARVTAWLLVVTAIAVGASWAGLPRAVRLCHYTTVAVIALACVGMMRVKRRRAPTAVFALDIAVLSMLGGRPNVIASALDAAERQLGIDLRSTWALNVLRRSAKPLLVGFCLLGWLTTGISIVRLNERALVERFGVLDDGPPLEPGIHLHWPWPIDRVIRVDTQRIRLVHIGHSGEIKHAGPENVLWARPHAKKEFTFLLGNGRDLIAIGAVVQFRVTDARAWALGFSNPTQTLRAIAYRVVLRSTVNHTLAEVLSENVGKVTQHMQQAVQHRADALGLGVHIIAFTIHGMHPPMSVARAYQHVVSAQVGEVTAAARANAYRNRTVPAAKADAIVAANSAQAKGAERLGKAAGEAWSFRTVEAQYKAAPKEFRFRRRLETLEKWLVGRVYTVIDARILRDGGGIWLKP